MLSFPGFRVQVQSFFKSKPNLATPPSFSRGLGRKGGIGQRPGCTPGSGSGASAVSNRRKSPSGKMSKIIFESGSNWHENSSQERSSRLQDAVTKAIVGVVNVLKAHLISDDPSTALFDALVDEVISLGIIVAVGLS